MPRQLRVGETIKSNLFQLWFVNEAEAARMLRHALDRGVNYFDTAYVYHEGNSETALGKVLRGHRNLVKIATKSPVCLKRFESCALRMGLSPEVFRQRI
jgi:aryl-alcohol dehydrogenase-like predicted oxidoreductase